MSEAAPSFAGDLRVSEVGHAYGDVRVLDSVSARLRPGRIHALLGENGAGKSTLLKIIAGLVNPSRGRVTVEERALACGDLRAIAYVEQHAELFESLTVHENVALGPWRGAEAVEVALARVGLPRADGNVVSLSLAERQLVLLARALFQKKAVMLLDEPTALATPVESARLYRVLRTLAEEGLTVVVVTHHLEEVIAHADEATVLRQGKVVLHGARGDGVFVEESLLRAMFGAVPPALVRAPTAGEVLGYVHDALGGKVELRRGEILGVAGMAGQGQEELARALRFGACGTFRWSGGFEAVALAADRHREAMVPSASVAENAMLGEFPARGPLAFVDREALSASAQNRIAPFAVRAPGLEAPMEDLSGGNQQKVVLARALACASSRAESERLLVVAEPTRGIDAAAAHMVHEAIASFAHTGGSVVLISSDLRELRRVADRYVVLWKGRFAGIFSAAEDEALAAAMATGGEGGAS